MKDLELTIAASLSMLDLVMVFHEESSFTHFYFGAEFRIADMHHNIAILNTLSTLLGKVTLLLLCQYDRLKKLGFNKSLSK